MFTINLTFIAILGAQFFTVVKSFTTRSMTPFASGSAGVRVIGTTSSLTGQAVKVIGDYNNDGLPDFAVSSTAVTISGRTGCGLVIIVLGQTTAWTEVDISTVTSGQSTRRVIGAAGGDNLGTSIGRAGDVNQDGYEDILIGAGGANFGGRTDAGAIYVLFGTTSASGYTDIDLASFAASAAGGYVIYGPIASSFLGNGLLSLQAFGDVNGDSIDDFAISAPNIDLSGVTDIGAAWFIYGSTATPVDLDLASLGSAGIELVGEATTDSLGISIDNVGDFNGDGKNDTIIGAYGYTSNSMTARGAAYLIYGTGSPVSFSMTSFVSGAAGVRFIGAAASNRAGSSVGGAGDINGDGKADLLIGASSAGCCGIVYAIFGTSTVFNADFNLGTLTAGPIGFTVSGVAANNALGWTVSRGGDLDQDGIDDYLLGAYNGLGRVYVLYGSLTAPSADIDLATYEGKVAGYGGSASALLGYSLSGGFDVNGDGAPDILMGARNAGVTPVVGATRATAGVGYLVHGPIYPWSASPTRSPSQNPTAAPSDPSAWPTMAPSAVPSQDPTQEPSVTPTEVPSALPTITPSEIPTEHPSVSPSEIPSEMPTLVPSVNPTITPSEVPSEMPTFMPSADPTMTPSEVPSEMPTLMPSADPTVTPSEVPSEMPTLIPSANPTMTPSEVPSEMPSVAPSAGPTITPPEVPSEMPTLMPSADPSMTPSEVPSEMPTLMPSADPTMIPSEMPSLAPSHDPSIMPSAVPSMNPSFAPSADPSTTPSHAPSEMPSLAPSVTPTTTPSAAPSANPSTAVTASPSKTPTMQPSVLPTVRPTDKPYQVVLAVQQDVYFVSKADYDSQKVQCNLTIQHTVAASMDGVVPERVTEIEVEETEAARFGNVRALTTTVLPPPVSLKYKVTVYDPVLSAEVLTAQLKAKVQSGEMDNAFRAFAVMFNATKMQNGTFSAPQITYVDQDGDSDESDSDVGLIVGVTVGGFIFLCLVILALCACHKRRKSNTTVLAAHN